MVFLEHKSRPKPRCPAHSTHRNSRKEETFMAWNKPVIREIECGMEINMYGPEHDDGVLF